MVVLLVVLLLVLSRVLGVILASLAVQFVLDAFERMHGGELYVPRIPSMSEMAGVYGLSGSFSSADALYVAQSK